MLNLRSSHGGALWSVGVCFIIASAFVTSTAYAQKEGKAGDANSKQDKSADGELAGGAEKASETSGETSQAAPSEHPVVKALRLTMERGDVKAASFLCDMERGKAFGGAGKVHPDVALRCAKVYLATGDAYAEKGKIEEANAQWSNAAAMRPSLKKDFLYKSRLRAYPLPGAGVTHSSEVSVVSAKARTTNKKTKRRPKVKKPKKIEPLGERGGKSFGLGLSGGFDGLLGVTISFLYEERLSVEVSVGVLFPTIDTRVRLYGTKDAITPVIGIGMTTPLADEAHFELDVPGYTALYSLGQTIHVDIGLAWTFYNVDVFGGMAFITSLEQDDPDRLLFFPQFGVQAQYMF